MNQSQKQQIKMTSDKLYMIAYYTSDTQEY